jgi:hypothetical protein
MDHISNFKKFLKLDKKHVSSWTNQYAQCLRENFELLTF